MRGVVPAVVVVDVKAFVVLAVVVAGGSGLFGLGVSGTSLSLMLLLYVGLVAGLSGGQDCSRVLVVGGL